MTDFNFFIVLTGENIKLKQRTNKFIEEYKKLEDKENVKLIISGKSSFDFFVKRENLESLEIKNYVLKNSEIKEEQIILESESMDTYGNIYFSTRILLKEIYKLKLNKKKN
jgi:uncharacterized SAM-binding protein YcdF (DUF218 family)